MDKVCDGKEDCPLTETSSGGEDESECDQGSGSLPPELAEDTTMAPTTTTTTTTTTTPSPTAVTDLPDSSVLCAGVALDPRRYLVPHPTICNKFFSCQNLGRKRYKAHLFLCPATTMFSSNLMVCNFANPACFNQPRPAQRSRGRGSRGRGGKKEKVKEVWSRVKKLWNGARKRRQRQPRNMRSFSSGGLWKSFCEKIQSFTRKARMITSL